ncbi:hypothetical protein HPB49_012982 [Dermacentor silvarum]|uniref:Uncharacterized protein n=1 Tax=Dermacentor silvarum TaxID=543639 RepID=A0ACB8E0M7_DERSI|nr:hypothetical protein HPB49_012982 [Dermacentor silvarum]
MGVGEIRYSGDSRSTALGFSLRGSVQLNPEIKEAVERDFRVQVKALRTEIRVDVYSMYHINAVFQDIRQNCDAIKAENAELKDENSKLRAELDGIKKRLAGAESHLQNSEQYSGKMNIEIKGIEEESPNKGVTAVVWKLGQLSGFVVVFAAGASVVDLRDNLPPLDGNCDAASAPDPHLLATAYVDLTDSTHRAPPAIPPVRSCVVNVIMSGKDKTKHRTVSL